MPLKTYMAVDQYGQTEHDLGPHPRKALLERLGRKKASKMYVDVPGGKTMHVGWVVAGRWFTVFEVKRMERAA